MISTPYPQNERLLLFWTNHFPVEYSSISEESISIAKQHLMFRENGFDDKCVDVNNDLAPDFVLTSTHLLADKNDGHQEYV